MKSEILKMLRHTDGYISGQEICEKFQVSRTAVWKTINQLKDEGYQIEAVRNKGYHIAGSPDKITKNEIESLLTTRWAGRKLFCYDEIDSTNLALRRLEGDDNVHGALAVADKQTAGRGRRGRTWQSPAGSSIFMSVLLKPDIAPEQAPMMTIVMAYSVVKAIRNLTGLDAKIKWPNDIVLNGKKVCGILTEMSAEIDFVHYVIIGIGINVNMETFPDEIRETATSLYIEGKKRVKRSRLIAEVFSEFEKDYEEFIDKKNLGGIMQPYNELLVNCEKEVRVLQPGKEYDGIAHGIDKEGNLLVETADGEIHRVYAGEVSVRGIYGYI